MKATLVAINNASQVETQTYGPIGLSDTARTYKWRMKIRSNYNKRTFYNDGNIDIADVIKLGFRIDDGYDSDEGNLVVIKGPGWVEKTGTVTRSYIYGLSPTEWTEVEFTATFRTNGGSIQLLIALSPIGQAVFVPGYFFEINDVRVTDDTGKVLLNYSGPPNFPLGSRMENVAWNGNFSDPIAWVCTRAGSPGLWSAIRLFDAFNAFKDPYLYGAKVIFPWGAMYGGDGDGSITVGNGQLVSVKGTSSYTEAQSVDEACLCAVAYELITESWNIPVGSFVFRYNYDGNTDLRHGPGVGTADRTLPGTFAVAVTRSVSFLCDVANATARMLMMRPKYPFLTKAPASFTAVPLTPAQTRFVPGPTGNWYQIVGVSIPTYAAGVLTFLGNNYGMIQTLLYPLVKGRTYRIRYNISATNAGASANLYLRNTSAQAENAFTFDMALGLHEGTFIPSLDGDIQVEFLSNGSASFGINYIRLYAE